MSKHMAIVYNRPKEIPFDTPASDSPQIRVAFISHLHRLLFSGYISADRIPCMHMSLTIHQKFSIRKVFQSGGPPTEPNQRVSIRISIQIQTVSPLAARPLGHLRITASTVSFAFQSYTFIRFRNSMSHSAHARPDGNLRCTSNQSKKLAES
ncbi:hypothetical protein K439DRAFT_491248 [Ramaria rubella]|nr:hypothetical protein K439DRAFT_696057 [Ramaria rubella]KAF8578261.1 hypothetical protein K439DRAFT_491248 [Ramaria rubella]